MDKKGYKMCYKEQMTKIIIAMSGSHSCYEIFRDFVEMSAISIQNGCSILHDKHYKAREEKYLSIAKKYTKEELKMMCNMLGLLQMALEEEMEDVLGQVYMESGCGSKYTGQFFTPFQLASLTAQVAIEKRNKIKLIEPSTGGGAMIIGAAKALKDMGIDYQRKLEVVAQDIDWIGVYMTYVQISLLGISGIVVQGDSLCEPYHAGYDRDRMLITPMKAGAIW